MRPPVVNNIFLLKPKLGLGKLQKRHHLCSASGASHNWLPPHFRRRDDEEKEDREHLRHQQDQLTAERARDVKEWLSTLRRRTSIAAEDDLHKVLVIRPQGTVTEEVVSFAQLLSDDFVQSDKGAEAAAAAAAAAASSTASWVPGRSSTSVPAAAPGSVPPTPSGQGSTSGLGLGRPHLAKTPRAGLRDLMKVGIGVSVGSHHFLRHPPCLLPRRGVLLLLLGPYKMAIFPDRAMFFDASRKITKLAAWEVAGEISKRRRYKLPFELFVLERMLQRISDKYTQRAILLKHLTDTILNQSADDAKRLETLVHLLPPLKSGLHDFDTRAAEIATAIQSIAQEPLQLHRLILSAKRHGSKAQEEVVALRDDAAVILDTCLRHFTVARREIGYLTHQVSGAQELAAIHVSLQRNRIIRLNLNMSIATLGFTFCSVVTGFMGMNIPLPSVLAVLEAQHRDLPFALVAAGSLLTASAICGAALARAYDRGARGREVRALQHQVRALKQAFRHISTIEHLLGEALLCHDTRLTRERFASLLSEEVGQEVDPLAVDFVFQAFDENKDNCLQPKEMQALIKAVDEVAASTQAEPFKRRS